MTIQIQDIVIHFTDIYTVIIVKNTFEGNSETASICTTLINSVSFKYVSAQFSIRLGTDVHDSIDCAVRIAILKKERTIEEAKQEELSVVVHIKRHKIKMSSCILFAIKIT